MRLFILFRASMPISLVISKLNFLKAATIVDNFSTLGANLIEEALWILVKIPSEKVIVLNLYKGKWNRYFLLVFLFWIYLFCWFLCFHSVYESNRCIFPFVYGIGEKCLSLLIVRVWVHYPKNVDVTSVSVFRCYDAFWINLHSANSRWGFIEIMQ